MTAYSSYEGIPAIANSRQFPIQLSFASQSDIFHGR